MSSAITLKVGNVTATLPLGGTDAQVVSVLARYAMMRTLPQEGTAQERLTALLGLIRDDIKLLAKRRHADDLRAAYEATISGTIEADNPL